MKGRYANLLSTVDALVPGVLSRPHSNRVLRFLEVGVYSGRHARRVNHQALKKGCPRVQYWGFDLFEDYCPVAHAHEGNKPGAVPTLEEVRTFLEAPQVEVTLIRGDSRQTLGKVLRFVKPLDLIFLDGGHSLETIRSDWGNVRKRLHPGSVVLFDDYYPDRDDVGCRSLIEELRQDRRYRVDLLDPLDSYRSGLAVRFARLRVTPTAAPSRTLLSARKENPLATRPEAESRLEPPTQAQPQDVETVATTSASRTTEPEPAHSIWLNPAKVQEFIKEVDADIELGFGPPRGLETEVSIPPEPEPGQVDREMRALNEAFFSALSPPCPVIDALVADIEAMQAEGLLSPEPLPELEPEPEPAVDAMAADFQGTQVQGLLPADPATILLSEQTRRDIEAWLEDPERRLTDKERRELLGELVEGEIITQPLADAYQAQTPTHPEAP